MGSRSIVLFLWVTKRFYTRICIVRTRIFLTNVNREVINVLHNASLNVHTLIRGLKKLYFNMSTHTIDLPLHHTQIVEQLIRFSVLFYKILTQ